MAGSPQSLLDIFVDPTDPRMQPMPNQAAQIAMPQMAAGIQPMMPPQPAQDPRMTLLANTQNTQVPMQMQLNGNYAAVPAMNAQSSTSIMGLSNRIQELLGARDADQGGIAQSILSGRFKPSLEDDATAIMKSAPLSAGLTTGQDVAQSNVVDRLKMINSLAETQKNLAMGDLYSNGGQGSQTLKLVNALNQDRINQGLPPLDTATALAVVKSPGAMPLTANPQGTQLVNVPGSAPAAQNIKQAESTGTKTGQENVERSVNITKAQGALQDYRQQNKLLTDAVNDALDNVSGWSTGYGALLSGVPNTQAGKLAGIIQTIRSNNIVNALNQMRQNSPTGGALGNVSNYEDAMLGALNGILDAKQPHLLVKNLQTLKTLLPQILQERERAFQQDYGNVTPLSGQAPTQPAPVIGATGGNSPQESPINLVPQGGQPNRVIHFNDLPD